MYKGKGGTRFCFIIISQKIPCLLSLLKSPSKNSKLANRLSVKPRTVNGRRRTDCLRRRLGDWQRRKKFRDERRRWNRNRRRRRNGGRGLRRPKRSTRDRRR
jgi:hypothetical protein